MILTFSLLSKMSSFSIADIFMFDSIIKAEILAATPITPTRIGIL